MQEPARAPFLDVGLGQAVDAGPMRPAARVVGLHADMGVYGRVGCAARHAVMVPPMVMPKGHSDSVRESARLAVEWTEGRVLGLPVVAELMQNEDTVADDFHGPAAVEHRR
jgi:hypothetical protein